MSIRANRTRRLRTPAPNELVRVEVADDTGFRAALALVREEQGGLVLRPLVWVGMAAVTAAIVVSAVIGGEPTAEARPVGEPPSAPVVQSTTVAPAPPSTIAMAPSASRTAPADMLWTAGTRLLV